MNNASPWTHFLLISPGVISWRSVVICCLPCSRIVIHAKRVGSISWYPFSPWQSSSELGSTHGLSKALLLVVKVVFVVFPNSAGILSLVVKVVFVGFHIQQEDLFVGFALSRAHFQPHCILSHIIARVRTAAHRIAQRGWREAITLHSETLTAWRGPRNPHAKDEQREGAHPEAPPKASRRPNEGRAKARPHHPHPSNHRRRPRRNGRDQGPGRLTSKG